MEALIDKLRGLYREVGKHSRYQILPHSLRRYVNQEELNVRSRYEQERLAFILENLTPCGKEILDIGGNTGFFSFEFLARGARRVYFFEGNRAHAEFVRIASRVLGCVERMEIFDKYFDFRRDFSDRSVDVTLLLNVLHHIGDDFDRSVVSKERAKERIIEYINYLSDKTRMLVFQMGFCWKGDRNHLLFECGTKREMIEFISGGVRGLWEIKAIGIPEREGGLLRYREVNERNIERDDSLGEFLNRPLFILESLGTR